mmetsp:Transcript_127130/g.395678  ORF Transcript_127130/g.395678 Transcript_127130/m.395678 type:complete len:147 (-) Transcript_127130:153-593(-)
MGSACCSESAHLSKEAKQDSMLSAEEYRAGSSEDAVILRMGDASAVKSSKSAINRPEKAVGRGEEQPPADAAAVPPAAPAAEGGSPPLEEPAAKVVDKDTVEQADADPDLNGLELENLGLVTVPNRDRDTGRELLTGLSARPNWAQ